MRQDTTEFSIILKPGNKFEQIVQKPFHISQASLKNPKGQLISECLLGVIDFPKNQRKIWQISALESKKWSNQQSKSTFL